MNKFLEKADRLILEDSTIVTDNGRLDFPSRLPFCPDERCSYSCSCVFGRIYRNLKYTSNLGREHVAIGKCCYIDLPNFLPIFYSEIDKYNEIYYERYILPVILKLYDPETMKNLWEIVKRSVTV